MQTQIETEGKTMTVYLHGELDHHNAPSVREKIDEFITGFSPGYAVLDFGGITFMDSSGIGLVMGRYKLLEALGCPLEIQNLSPHAYKVMRLAGLDTLAKLHKQNEKGGKTHETAQ